MNPAPTFPEPEYVDLFGIGREDLDKLGEAGRQADDARISLRDWRETYASVLSDHAGVGAAIAEVLDAWMRRCSTIWFGREHDDIPPTWADLDPEERRARSRALMTDLSALRPPPADEDLQQLFAEADQNERSARAKGQAEMVDLYAEQKQRVSRWIAETDGVPRDPWSGLRTDSIEKYRWIDDDVLGRTPVAFRAAMAQAWLDADAGERKLAAGIANAPERSETDWKATHAFAALSGTVLTEFLRWLDTSEDPSAAAVMREWRHGNLPQLVQEYLDDRS